MLERIFLDLLFNFSLTLWLRLLPIKSRGWWLNHSIVLCFTLFFLLDEHNDIVLVVVVLSIVHLDVLKLMDVDIVPWIRVIDVDLLIYGLLKLVEVLLLISVKEPLRPPKILDSVPAAAILINRR